MSYPNISIDTYDFVLIASLLGGFYTGNWLPFTLLIAFEFIKEIYSFCQTNETDVPNPPPQTLKSNL